MKIIMPFLLILSLALPMIGCETTISPIESTAAESDIVSESVNEQIEVLSETKQEANALTPISSALVATVKKICEKETTKEFLKGKSAIDEIRNLANQLPEIDKKNAIAMIPGLTFDESNFSNDESKYSWVTNFFKFILKDAIQKGNLTQEGLNQIKLPLAMMGVNIPNFNIDKNMSNEDFDASFNDFVEFMDKITEKETFDKIKVLLSFVSNDGPSAN